MSGPGPTSGSELLADLAARGLVADHTDRDALSGRLDTPTPLYCGFDPTAESLHIGNLQSIMLLRRFQLAGHPPVALVGGATGMIGDPSGRSTERNFLPSDVLDRNRAAIGLQLQGFLDFTGSPTAATLVDNRDWTQDMGVLEFLRDVGKFVTVNTMLAKDSVRSRMERDSGISFTEFAYMLLQANDYRVLHERRGVDLQVAGSDQWGNITAGVDLIRRRTGDQVHGLTAPLIVRADGTKFGKSEGDNVWLSAELTSPYQMYQYLMNVGDDDVEQLLARLTTVPVPECAAVGAAHRAAPELRDGQRRLARELTAMVHGPEVLGPIEAATAVAFGGLPTEADEATFALLAREIPSQVISHGDFEALDVLGLFVATPLAASRGEVRKNAAGHYLNGEPVSERPTGTLDADDLLLGRYLMLRKGRRRHHLVVVAD